MAVSKSAPGPTEIAAWQNQTITSGNTVSGNGAVGGVGTDPIAVEIYNMTDAQRLQRAQQLNNAGFKVPLTGKYNDTLVSQMSNAVAAAKVSAAKIGQQFNNNYFTGYLQQQYIANAAMGGSGASNAPFQRKQISSATEAAGIINAVYTDLLGRQASKKELDKYTKAIQAAQEANPVKYTDTAGAGYTARGGIDPQQFLIQQIAGTDEAKARQVSNYYDVFKNAIGVR